jgi:hypothetical protein
VRRARALARIPGREDDAENEMRAAQLGQPAIQYVATERARLLGERGRFTEADQALRSCRSNLTRIGRLELAQVRALLAQDFIDGARQRRELRKPLPWLEANYAELAKLSDELEGDLDETEKRNLVGWQAKTAWFQGQIFAELDEHQQAATAFKTSMDLYSTDTVYLQNTLFVADMLGNEQVKLGDLDAAAKSFGKGMAFWKAQKRLSDARADTMRVAGNHALARMALRDDTFLRRYAEEFAGDVPGPFEVIADKASPLLALPGMAQRLKLSIDARLSRGTTVWQARDLVFALRALIKRDVAPVDVAGEANKARSIQPWLDATRLELDSGLTNGEPDPVPQLIAQAKQVRLKVQARWGVILSGIRITDGQFGAGRYRIRLGGRTVRDGQIEGTNNGPIFEACLEAHAWDLVGHKELWWMLDGNNLLPKTGSRERAEAESAHSMLPLLALVRRLLQERVTLVDFASVYARFRDARQSGATLPGLIEDIRRDRKINPDLWGSEPGRALFRFSSQDAARLSAMIASSGSDWAWLARNVAELVGGLPPDQASVLVPDGSLRWPMQQLVAMSRSDIPVVTTEEVSTVAQAGATILKLPEREQSPQPSLADVTPAASPRLTGLELRGMVVREAARRGLAGANAALAAYRIAKAAVRREENWGYAVALAFDRYGPDAIKLRAGPKSFAVLATWSEQGAPDRFRLEVYDGTGVWLPPLRLVLDDALAPDAWTVGFNDWQEPQSSPPSPDGTGIGIAIVKALIGRLSVFIDNHRLELMLDRLNAEHSLLVFNLLERYRLPALLAELRGLVDAGRSIRNLQRVAEILLRHSRSVAEPWDALPGALPEFFHNS